MQPKKIKYTGHVLLAAYQSVSWETKNGPDAVLVIQNQGVLPLHAVVTGVPENGISCQVQMQVVDGSPNRLWIVPEYSDLTLHGDFKGAVINVTNLPYKTNVGLFYIQAQ